MKDSSKKLEKNLDNILTNKDITQIETGSAKKLGFDNFFIGNLENRETNHAFLTITNFTRPLEVSAYELLK